MPTFIACSSLGEDHAPVLARIDDAPTLNTLLL
jgi:hypothetical protein